MSQMNAESQRITVYGDCASRHAYKLYLLKALAHLDIDWQFTDIFDGSTRTPEHLARNPMGQVPTVILADGRALPESNAALMYMAEGTDLLPDDSYDRAQVLRWLMFEQNQIDPALAVSLSLKKGLYEIDNKDAVVAYLAPKVARLLDAVERHLSKSESGWFVGQGHSIADIAIYAYVHEATSAEFDLGPATKAWIEKVEDLAGWISVVDAMALERKA